jgi:hypothetical protein
MKSKSRQYSEIETPSVPIPAPIPAFSWKGSLSPALLIPMAVPVLVALFGPDNILDLLPLARRFTEWVQHIIPFVRMSGHADSTTYPQVALLVHSLSLTLIPLASLVFLWQGILNYPQILARSKARGRLKVGQHLLILIVAPLFMLGIMYVLVALPGDPSFAKGATTHSRGGLAFMTFVATYMTSATFGGQLTNVRLFIDLYMKRGA